uniref:Uncharacterized protein n=2 Tax=Moniliophthora roreri TaxID=221103 RepID=A0A0W0EWS6_MONRR
MYFPPEILSEIFSRVVVCNIFGRNRGSWSEASHLGSICRYWRSVSLNTPDIWARISVFIENDTHHQAVFPGLVDHLIRAKSVSLTIEINIATSLWYGWHRHASLDCLLTHVHRWGHLTFFALDAGALISLLDRVRSSAKAPLMRSVLLSLPNLDSRTLNCLDRLAPDLSSVSIPHLRFRWTDIASSTTFLSHLTHVHIYTFTQTIIEMLQRCTRLVSAHIEINIPSRTREEPFMFYATHPAKLMFLTTLTISACSSSNIWRDYPFEDIYSILDSIETPVLTCLTLSSDANEPQEVELKHRIPHNKGPLERADARLRFTQSLYSHIEELHTLHIECIPLTDKDLLRLSKGMSNLQRLIIREPAVQKVVHRGFPSDVDRRYAPPSDANLNHIVTDNLLRQDLSDHLSNLTHLQLTIHQWPLARELESRWKETLTSVYMYIQYT